MLGRTLGDFVIKERIGLGGGGEVFRAEQVTLGREAVIKVMARVESTERAGERFLREARLASQLDHPFAAHVYGFGVEPDGVLWIAMELVRGTPLDTIIKEQGALPLPRFVPFFERLCEVLQAAHEQGIVHRDIKPANIMVISRAGRLLPKLLDLGIARRDATDPKAANEPKDLGSQLVSEIDGQPTETNHGPTSKTDHLQTSHDGLTSSSAQGGQTLANQLESAETMNLTQVGAVIGTPAYMAPEQWADASAADARADLYSLSLVAYQAITGVQAFTGKSIRSLARAHARDSLPALPEHLPARLHAVLSKGSAKNPADRYATAIELAAALRAASDIGVEPFALPPLDEGLRENVLNGAPQPIAESVALFEGARTPRHQLAAVFMVRKVVIRHLAILALACRARIGPGSPEDSVGVKDLLSSLAKDQLTDHEWLSLAKELCRPFSFRKGAHPLPELVSFFFERATDVTAAAGLNALTAFDSLPLPAHDAADHVVHAALLKLVPALGNVLRNLTFLFDYALTLRRVETERWMGTRRVVRMPQLVTSASPQGAVFLVDAAGVEVLTLAPLMQVLSPGANLPEELFILDGAGRHGARMVALPAPFERQSDEIWPWFSKNVFDVVSEQQASAQADKPPYKGLSTFAVGDADHYFGREKETESFANRLRMSPLLAVVGPSGSGKSSFVLAGVLPLLPPGWRSVVMRPGPTPLQSLTHRLTAAGIQSAELTPQELFAALPVGESLLLVVDQFEELVTLCPDAVMRETFSQLLVDLSEQSAGRVKVVLTLRDDFLIRVQQLPALRERLSSALQLLGTPAKAELLRVITEPARRVGYGFDDETLPARMVTEVSEYSGALALLSFTASQLWELRDRQLQQMRSQTYEALGGVGGALAHHAEMTLAQMGPDEGALVREAFRHLVTSESTRAVLSRKEMLDVLGNSSAATSVLEKLVVARLLVTSEDGGGDDKIEIIHEALIASWPRLVGWLREDAETARLRDSLRASARQWAERGRESGLLWRKETLAEYRVWRTRFAGRLTQIEEEFAAASVKDDARARTFRRLLVAGIMLGLSVAIVTLYRSNAESNHRLIDLRIEQARLSNLDNKVFGSKHFVEEARSIGGQGAMLDYLEARAQTRLEGEVAQANVGEAAALRSAPDGGLLAAVGSDGALRLLALPNLRLVLSLPPHLGPSHSFAFDPHGRYGYLCSGDGLITTLDLSALPAARETKTRGGLGACQISPDGQILAVSFVNGQVALWSVGPDGALGEERVLDAVNDYRGLQFSPDSHWLLAYHTDRAKGPAAPIFVPVIDVASARLAAKLPYSDRVNVGDFSPNGAIVAIAGTASEIRVFSTDGGTELTTLYGHAGWTNELRFLNNETLVSANSDRTVRQWRLDGRPLATLMHDAPVGRVQVTADGHTVTTTTDGVIHIWAPEVESPVVEFFGHVSGPVGFASIDAHRFASADTDGTIHLWDTEAVRSIKFIDVRDSLTASFVSKKGDWILAGPDGTHFSRWRVSDGSLLDRMDSPGCAADWNLAMDGEDPPLVAAGDENTLCLFRWGSSAPSERLEGHTGTIRRLAFSPDGKLVATSSIDRSVIVWDVQAHSMLARFDHDVVVEPVMFSPDGTKLVSGTENGTVFLWSVTERRLLRKWKASGERLLDVAFFDGDRGVSSSGKDQTIVLSDAETGTILQRLSGSTNTVSGARVSTDGKLIASIDWDGNVGIWDREQGKLIDQIRVGGTSYSIAWLPGGGVATVLGNHHTLVVSFPTIRGASASPAAARP